MLKSGQLIRIERGIYSLSDNAQKDFSVICTEEMKNINQQIKGQFPFVNYCLWTASTLIPYMHHLPNVSFMCVDVEREVVESVFNLLNTNSNKRVFLMPSSTDFERYINTGDAIIIRPLISESPLQMVAGVNTPTIEKILVDLIADIEFSFLQGSELDAVFTTVFERHTVNKNKLLRYAARRGKKEEVEELFKFNQL